jgi:NAD(P)-dependent dehydrogenase (short-subunit alcohol dehydrogenase family)
MEDQTIVITGATAGIGLAAAQELARRGARILGVSRNPEKCARTAAELRRATGNPAIDFLPADLSLQKDIRRLAGEIQSAYPHIHALINNAGAINLRRELTAEGIERTFALNHLGYFLFTHLLLDRLPRGARIINVSSSAQYRGVIHWDDPGLARGYRPFKAYRQSKLANMLYTHELARRLEGRGITVNAMHPGLVKTDIGRDQGWLAWLLRGYVLRRALTPEEGARTLVYLAASPEAAGVTGRFFVREQVRAPASASLDEEAARRLWEMSEMMAGIA